MSGLRIGDLIPEGLAWKPQPKAEAPTARELALQQIHEEWDHQVAHAISNPDGGRLPARPSATSADVDERAKQIEAEAAAKAKAEALAKRDEKAKKKADKVARKTEKKAAKAQTFNAAVATAVAAELAKRGGA